MKKRKSMALLYFFTYIVWLFAGIIPAMLLYKSALAGSIIFLVLDILVLPPIIAGQVYEHKYANSLTDFDFKMHVYFTSGGFAGVIILALIGLIIEAVLTGKGESAPYPWFITITAFVIMGLISAIFINRTLTDIRKKKFTELHKKEIQQ